MLDRAIFARKLSGLPYVDIFHKIKYILLPVYQKETVMDVISEIIGWCEARNLIDGSNPKDQFHKLVQECGEFSDAFLKGDLEHAAMELGDVFVVAILIAVQMGHDPEDVMEMAYHKIKDRKGMMLNGVFVKQEDLDGGLCS